jgi:hypothetical protein
MLTENFFRCINHGLKKNNKLPSKLSGSEEVLGEIIDEHRNVLLVLECAQTNFDNKITTTREFGGKSNE